MRTVSVLLLMLVGVSSFAESKQVIAQNIRTVASVAGLDPDLALAIATVESGLNPNVVGGLGEIGLFQLRPEYHKVFKGHPEHNLLVGIAYLAELQKKYFKKYGDAWFVLYNYGPYNPPKFPKNTAYYKKVMKELNRLKIKKYLAVN